MAPVVGPAASRSRADKRKGKRNAEKRCSVTAASRDAARALRRARLSAFHHGTCGSDRTPPLSSSHATSQDNSERTSRWFERSRASQHTTRSQQNRLPCVTRGRYPRLTVPAQRDCTRSPVMMPSGRVLPKPPGSRGDEPRPAGTALAPPDGVTQPASWYGGEIRHLVPHYVTICQVCVLCSATTRLRLVILKARANGSGPKWPARGQAQRASEDATTAPLCVLRGSTLRVEHLSMTIQEICRERLPPSAVLSLVAFTPPTAHTVEFRRPVAML